MSRRLEVTGLTAGYRGHDILRGLTLQSIAGGALTALVGPNGAGKSTLLRALAGLVPARGTVALDGEDLLALPPAQRAAKVTLMPQAIPQGIRLSVLEGVLGALHASALREPPRDRADAEARAMGVLRRLGLTHLALAPLDQLSGGERQLASLAQALVRDPQLLLLDEPTSALDLRHQAVVMQLARDLAEEGRIVVVVLHDLTLAARWAHRAVVLDRGAVGAEGPIAEAVTAEVLARVYGVAARIEHCTAGWPQVIVDGLVARR